MDTQEKAGRTCPEGKFITSLGECRHAIRELGIRSIGESDRISTQIPSGCSIDTEVNNKLHFNPNEHSLPGSQNTPICRSSIQKRDPSPESYAFVRREVSNKMTKGLQRAF